MNITRRKRSQTQNCLPNSSSLISSDLTPIGLYNILINNGSLINQRDLKGETFLSYAIRRNKIDCFKLLLTSPILDLNYIDKEGNSYLEIAVICHRENMIVPLINKGINLNIKNKDGNTALHLAYLEQCFNIVNILIKNNIDCEIQNNKGEIASDLNKENQEKNNLENKEEEKNLEEKKEEEKKEEESNIKEENKEEEKKEETNIEEKNKEENKEEKKEEEINIEVKKEEEINKEEKNIEGKKEEEINIEEKKEEEIDIEENKEENKKEDNTKDLEDDLINTNISLDHPINQKQHYYDDMDNVNTGLSLMFPKNINESEERISNSNNNNKKEIKIKESYDSDFFKLSVDLPKKENKDVVNDYFNEEDLVNSSIDNTKKSKNNFDKRPSSNSNIDFSISDDEESDKNDIFISKSNTKKSSDKYDDNYNPLDDNEEDNFKIDTDEDKCENNNKINSNKTITNVDFNNLISQSQNQKLNINHKLNESDNVNEEITERGKHLSLNFDQPIRTGQIKYFETKTNNLKDININNKKFNDNYKNPLYQFLKNLSLEKYFTYLYNNGFDDINLLISQTKGKEKEKIGISDDNLRKLGIRIPGDRAKILIKIQEEAGNFNFKIPKEVYYTCINITNFLHDNVINKLNNWLKEIKLDMYLENFLNAGYHSKELLVYQMISKQPLNNDILEYEIGIDKLGFRKRILNELIEEAKKLQKMFNFDFDFSFVKNFFNDIDINKQVEKVNEKIKQVKDDCNIF